jgi:hypothetical protein
VSVVAGSVNVVGTVKVVKGNVKEVVVKGTVTVVGTVRVVAGSVSVVGTVSVVGMVSVVAGKVIVVGMVTWALVGAVSVSVRYEPYTASRVATKSATNFGRNFTRACPFRPLNVMRGNI